MEEEDKDNGILLGTSTLLLLQLGSLAGLLLALTLTLLRNLSTFDPSFVERKRGKVGVRILRLFAATIHEEFLNELEAVEEADEAGEGDSDWGHECL